MKIGNVKIQNLFILAPMAGVNCTAFRLLCKENGAGLIYTQMYDSDIIATKTKSEVRQFLNIKDVERPVAVQLIGNNVENLVKSVKLVEDFADIIDFNIGCTEPDFLEKGAGAVLLKDLNRLKLLIDAIVGATKKTVTAKIRIGWDDQHINAVAVCKLLESSGIQAIAIHGRTAKQKNSGKVNHLIMKQVKEKVNIPIIISGDIKNLENAKEILSKTNCDFAMIGREAMHCPWIFDKAKQDAGNKEIKKQILRFIEFYEKYENRESHQEVSQHVYWMLRNYKTEEDMKRVQKFDSIDKIRYFVSMLD